SMVMGSSRAARRACTGLGSPDGQAVLTILKPQSPRPIPRLRRATQKLTAAWSSDRAALRGAARLHRFGQPRGAGRVDDVEASVAQADSKAAPRNAKLTEFSLTPCAGWSWDRAARR